MIDRESPRKRPSEEPIGYQNWRELLFLHWSVDPADLIKLIPPELELDLWRGEALVGVVPFRMEGVRPWWAPKAFGFNFLETNLRIYVLHKGEPGVFFFSLDAESHIAVQAAKLGWSLPYYYAQMSTSDQDGLIQYQTQRPSSSLPDLEVSYRRGSPINPIEPDSLEFFLLERYVLFTPSVRIVFASSKQKLDGASGIKNYGENWLLFRVERIYQKALPIT